MAGGSKKVIIISLLANLAIAVSKLIGAMITGSAALLAEAIHSFSDCGNQGLLLYGGHVSHKPPTPQYPLGRSKEMFFWSFVVALLLFSGGGLFSLYEGIHKLQRPEPLHHPIVAIVILVIAVGLEGFSFWACLKEVRAHSPSTTLWQWIRTTSSADLLVIFLEDLAALLGLVLALGALLLAWITGNPFWDGLGSCLIGAGLIIVAIILAREVKPMLVGQSAGNQYRQTLEQQIGSFFPDGRVLTALALQQGVNAVLLAYKIHPGNPDMPGGEMIRRLNDLERVMRDRHPELQWQFAELDDHV